MFESKTPLRETEAAFLFVRGNAASSASFCHDPRSAFEALEPGAGGGCRALIQLNTPSGVSS
jgi:hypothetical protein